MAKKMAGNEEIVQGYQIFFFNNFIKIINYIKLYSCIKTSRPPSYKINQINPPYTKMTKFNPISKKYHKSPLPTKLTIINPPSYKNDQIKTPFLKKFKERGPCCTFF